MSKAKGKSATTKTIVGAVLMSLTLSAMAANEDYGSDIKRLNDEVLGLNRVVGNLGEASAQNIQGLKTVTDMAKNTAEDVTKLTNKVDEHKAELKEKIETVDDQAKAYKKDADSKIVAINKAITDSKTDTDNAREKLEKKVTDHKTQFDALKKELKEDGKGIKYFHADSTKGDSRAKGTDAVAVGPEATAQGEGAVAVGDKALANGNGANALGQAAEASGHGATAMGVGAKASGYATAMGSGAKASGYAATAVGHAANAMGDSAIAIGNKAKAWGKDTVNGNETRGASVAIGDGAHATAPESVSIGLGAGQWTSPAQITTDVSNVAIGTRSGQTVTGSFNNAMGNEAGKNVTGQYNNAIGYFAGNHVEGSGNVALGKEANAALMEGKEPVVQEYNNTVALGSQTKANKDNAVAIGNGAQSLGDGAIAIGQGSNSADVNGLALGQGALSSGASVALGAGSSTIGFKANTPAYLTKTTTTSIVSVGRLGSERRISNVADGSAAQDAVTVNQLKTAQQQVAGVLGTAATFDKVTGELTFAYGKKQYSSVTAVLEAFKHGVVVDGPIADAAVLYSEHGDATSVVLNGKGGATIKNVKAAVNGNEAVNLDQLNAHVNAAKPHFFSVNSDTKMANGNNEGAAGENAVAVGAAATATGGHSTAMGYGAKAGLVARKDSGEAYSEEELEKLPAEERAAFIAAQKKIVGAVAVGYGSNAEGHQSVAIGRESKAQKENTVAMGYKADANSIGGVAIGQQALVSQGQSDGKAATDGVSVGTKATVTRYDGIAIGHNALSEADQAIAQGANSKASNQQDIALGVSAEAKGGQSTAIGMLSKANNTDSIAMGTQARSDGERASAIGREASSKGSDAIAMGTQANASVQNSTAIGFKAAASGADAIAMGSGASAKATSGGAFGKGAGSTAANAFAMGTNAQATKDSSYALGDGANAMAGNAFALGSSALSTKESSYALGTDANAIAENAYALGKSAQATAKDAYALGTEAQAFAAKSMALGSGAKVVNANSIALGAGSVAMFSKDKSTAIYSNIENNDALAGVVSVGNGNSKRRIANVAGGEADTDAVNVAQLKALDVKLTNDGLNFVGNDGKNIHRKLKETLSIKGNLSAQNAAGGTSGENVITRAELDKDGNPTGVLNIELAKNVTFDRVTTGNSKLDTDGLEIAGKDGKTTSVSAGNIKVSGKSVAGDVNTLVLDAGAGTLTGLSNTTLDASDFATVGRAATEEQLQLVDNKVNELDDFAVKYDTVKDTNGNTVVDRNNVTFGGTELAAEQPVEGGRIVMDPDTGTHLKNVASAGDYTDVKNAGNAVNAGDLNNALIDTKGALTDLGFSLTADKGVVDAQGNEVNSVKKNLGESIEVVGADENISTKAEDGKIQIELAKQLSVESVTTIDANGNASVYGPKGISISNKLGNIYVNQDGLSFTNSNGDPVGPRVTQKGINAGDQHITNVAAGTERDHAVNLGQLDDAIDKLKWHLEDGSNPGDGGAIVRPGEGAGNGTGTSNGNGTNPGNGNGNNTGSQPGVGGGNTVVMKGENNIKVTVDKDTNTVTIGTAGDAHIGAGSKDVATGGQLHEVINNIIGGNSTFETTKDGKIVNHTNFHVAGSDQKTVKDALEAIDNSAVHYDKKADGSVDKSKVTLGEKGTEVTVGNVAAGVKDNDAVNVSQLKGAVTKIDNQFLEVNQNVGQLAKKVDDIDKDSRAGVAAAMAAAALPQAYLPGKSMMSMAGSTWRGESGYAIGVSTISDNGNWVVKANMTGNARSQYGAAAGVGYQW